MEKERKVFMANNFVKFLSNVVNSTKSQIVELAKTELNNVDKKQKLDDYIINLITSTMTNYAPTGVVGKFCFNYVVKKFVIPYVDDLTQIVYNLLKSKIVGITE
jgi:hypothetical protein